MRMEETSIPLTDEANMETKPKSNGNIASVNGNGLTKKENTEKNELTKLLIQTLGDLGYSSIAEQLSNDSGLSVESSQVVELRDSILKGRWVRAEELLHHVQLVEEADISSVIFLVREQKYLEMLESKNYSEALAVLRSELTPLGQNVKKLHTLSSLIMCAPKEIKERIGWDGVKGRSRKKLLDRLQKHISPYSMIPPHRLTTLIHQAKEYQVAKCLYHNTTQSFSLFSDHSCDRNQFPSSIYQTLSAHKDEVWSVRFSHNGHHLASCSKDSSLIIWNLEEFRAVHKLTEHENGVAACDWSPDDSLLLSCGNDKKVKLWNTVTGVCVKTLTEHTEPVSAAIWLPSGKGFVTGSLDHDIIIWQMKNLNPVVQHRFTGYRILDMKITPNGEKLIAICTKKKIHVYDLRNMKPFATIELNHVATCISVLGDNRHVLINNKAPELNLWDIEEMKMVRKYVGQHQTQFIIRSCFGGLKDTFVLSGSEDSRIYVWHREHGTLVERLTGHTGAVNCVAWNPTDPFMFASAADDGTIKLWSKAKTSGKTHSHSKRVSKTSS